MSSRTSIEFFDKQFRQQVVRGELELNPFESATLPYLSGTVLDFGCGLGNLAIHAARQGLPVLALDASETAIQHIDKVARAEGLPLQATLADLRHYDQQGTFDSVVSIGLLMFFDCPTADRQLEYLKSRVKPGGIASINVLTTGTSFMAMFSLEGHCLFEPEELARRFDGWTVLLKEQSIYAAPGNTWKAFCSLIARRPESDAPHSADSAQDTTSDAK